MVITYKQFKKLDFQIFLLDSSNWEIADGLLLLDGKLLDDKNFEYVNGLLKEYSSLDDLKSIYDKGEIYNMSNIDFNTNSIQNVGFSPEAIGVAFSLEEGEMTRPIKIDDGIIVLSLNSISQADSLNSYSDYGISLLQANKFTSSLKVDNAIKEFSNIEDLRYKFF